MSNSTNKSKTPHLESPEHKQARYNKVSVFTKSKGFIYLTLLTITALFGSSFLMGICTPLAYCKWTINLHRRLADRVLGGWFLFTVSLMELVLNMKIKVTGDEIVRGENCVYILNHRTRFDWMWIWPLLYHYARLRKLKIVLKSPLKWVPGFGWACQQGAFLFLERSWSKDKKYMQNVLEYFNRVDEPIELLVFPEGTDFRPGAIASSAKFAKKNNLPEYNYILHPRITGFEFLVNELRSSKQISYVCDLTVGYPMNILQDEVDLCKFGNFPQETHFHVDKFKIEDLPSTYTNSELDNTTSTLPLNKISSNKASSKSSSSADTVGDWLNRRFLLKEKRLEKFYSEKNKNKRKFEDTESKTSYNSRTLGLYLSLVLWPTFTFIWICCLVKVRYPIFPNTYYIFLLHRANFLRRIRYTLSTNRVIFKK